MKKQILAIDDSKAIRFLLQTILSKDYQVITMPDGCSAMYWLSKKNLPDLIIADPQYFLKPFNPVDLLSVINNLIRKQVIDKNFFNAN
jgi:DNA-binding response OmpR family regulator